jgi:hypothetical protein
MAAHGAGAMTLEALIERISEIRAATATDTRLKARFVADPMALMAEMGVDFPSGVVLETHDSADNLPAEAVLTFPPSNPGALTEAQLEMIANVGYGGDPHHDFS